MIILHIIDGALIVAVAITFIFLRGLYEKNIRMATALVMLTRALDAQGIFKGLKCNCPDCVKGDKNEKTVEDPD